MLDNPNCYGNLILNQNRYGKENCHTQGNREYIQGKLPNILQPIAYEDFQS